VGPNRDTASGKRAFRAGSHFPTRRLDGYPKTTEIGFERPLTDIIWAETKGFRHSYPYNERSQAAIERKNSIGICATGGAACHRCWAGLSLAALFDSRSNGPRGLLGWSWIGVQAVRARGRVAALAAVSGPAVGLAVVDRSLFDLLTYQFRCLCDYSSSSMSGPFTRTL
jgi:hypothetical protein